MGDFEGVGRKRLLYCEKTENLVSWGDSLTCRALRVRGMLLLNYCLYLYAI